MSKYQLLVVFFILPTQQIECTSKLHVQVFYESLCPDSLNFVTQQLHPVAEELAPHIDLKLIPFGKSVSFKISDDNVQFICQHGSQECKGNKVQSCALNAISDQIAQVEYVNCFMKTFKKGQKNEGEYGQRCAEAVGLDSNYVSECYSSPLGTQLQLLAEQMTATISPKFVPTIVYNRRFDQQLQDGSLTDFRGVVCQLLQQTHPEACQNSSVIRL